MNTSAPETVIGSQQQQEAATQKLVTDLVEATIELPPDEAREARRRIAENALREAEQADAARRHH